MTAQHYEILITRRAEKDVKRLTPKLRKKLLAILTEVIGQDPYQGKKLLGDLAGSYSYRLTYQDRIIYSIHRGKKTIFSERAATHYGE